MNRQDFLLAFLYLPAKQGDKVAAEPIDPIRIMKGLFLFGMEKRTELRDFYVFEPYLYGPCSFQVYSDLRDLIAAGNVDELVLSPFHRWSYYRLTEQGKRRAQQVIAVLPEALVVKLRNVKETVMSKSFLDLLRYIYEKYPAYAAESIIRFRS